MRDDKTAATIDSKSFEDRVFARFDSVEGRLLNVEIRIGKLEERQYDTKPIWEQALAAIAETNERMRAGFEEIHAQLALLNAKFDAKFDAIDARFDALEVKFEARFTKQDTDIENGLRGVERKVDVLNRNILELRADQRYVDSRLEKIEGQAKPS